MIARGRSYFPKFQHRRNPVSSKIPGFFSANYTGGPVLGNMRWVCLSFMSMRIPIIALLTLAAPAGGELAARAIDPIFAPTQTELREGTAEIDRRDACPTRVQTEDEVSLTSGTILKNGQDAGSTRDELFCGTGILPVHKKLIENGATSQVSPTVRDLPASDELAASKEVRAAQLSPSESPSYRFRLYDNNKIESTANTQPLSFSTPSQHLTLNSQQSTINNHSGATGIDITEVQPP